MLVFNISFTSTKGEVMFSPRFVGLVGLFVSLSMGLLTKLYQIDEFSLYYCESNYTSAQ